LANHKSAIKRATQNEGRRLRNRARKTRMKNAIKDVMEAVSSSSHEIVAARLKDAIGIIDKTASKKTIHRNSASRKISRLTLRVNTLLAKQSS